MLSACLNHCMRLKLDMQQQMLNDLEVHVTAGVSGIGLKRRPIKNVQYKQIYDAT